MLQIRRILFPTDFSECAERAYAHAALLSARYGSELHVLNVLPPDVAPPNNPMAFLDEAAGAGEPVEIVASAPAQASHASAALTDFEPPPGAEAPPTVYSQLRSPSIIKGILEYGRAHDVDLIVMGTHGRQGIDHLMLGSVAEEIVRNASRPVLTVRYDESTPTATAVRRILVPIDFSEFSPLDVAVELARTYGAELDMLHVIEEAVLPTIYGVEPLSPNAPLYIERTEGALRKLLDDAGASDVVASQHVRIGHAPRRILEFADERRVDLIVLGSHGRTGLSRLLIGSVAEKVVRLAPCPVFTVKSYGKPILGRQEGAAAMQPNAAAVPKSAQASNGSAGTAARLAAGT